ncbi:MAG TPA: hypothetical protein VFA85_18770 [Terriglobales bacterium]|nr:hypothetical protein [Terriglobales bacterium]
MTPGSSTPHPSRAAMVLLGFLLLFGLYVPTSFSGTYSIPLWLGALGFIGLVALAASFRPNGIGSPFSVINSLVLVAAIIASSLVSPFPEYRWGGLLPFTVLALIYTLNMKDLTAGPYLRIAFIFTNILNLIAGAAVISHSSWIDNFLVTHYTSFYPELVSSMTDLGKPVLTFGSHSAAAFFFYLLFLLDLESFAVFKRKLYLGFALGYIALGFALFSVTGVVLMTVATAQLVWLLARRNWRQLVLGASLAAACVTIVVEHYSLDIRAASDAVVLAEQAAATSDVNGFSGRFSELGTLYTTVKYIKDRPFSPVGIGYRSDLFFGDSGPVEYFLRGSVVLVVCMYGGLFFFLKRNLISKRHLLALFSAIFAFELGFSSLTYLRLICLLPVFVIYLNDLSRREISDAFERSAPA